MGRKQNKQTMLQRVTVDDPAFADCVAKAKEWKKGFTSLKRSLTRSGLLLEKPARQELQRIFDEMRSAQGIMILSRYGDAEIKEIEKRIREAPSYERRKLRRLIATRLLQQRGFDYQNASTELCQMLRDVGSYERKFIKKLIHRKKIRARRSRKRKDATS